MTESPRKRVSIVIPTWNGRDLLLACLDSLAEQTFRDFETVVIDDGSTDDTVGAINERFPDVLLVSLGTNRGFCRAVNAGIKHATAELIVLLNNDITVAPDFLANLVRAADSSGAAMFAPLILWRDEPETIYSAGDAQRTTGRPESIGFRQALNAFEFPEEIFGVCAGAAMYRRELFESVGVLDPAYDIYFSDSDLSFRARLAGFHARFVRDAVAWHVGSASLFGKPLKRTRQCCVNHALLVLKNMPFRLLLRHAPEIAMERLHQVRRVFSAARTEYGAFRAATDVVRTLASILPLLPHVFRERRRIQRSRKLDIEALDGLLKR